MESEVMGEVPKQEVAAPKFSPYEVELLEFIRRAKHDVETRIANENYLQIRLDYSKYLVENDGENEEAKQFLDLVMFDFENNAKEKAAQEKFLAYCTARLEEIKANKV